ncbi:chromosome partitioning protein ParB [Agrobacterium fabrum]|uniref:ParB-like protein n=1 Tax=Agrobacterium fabrum TaxID=1176649 RepID=UPI000EF56174|nr:ParB-like protein [Agrobacterium fabrum]AYM62333.1 hypothetical protein At12D13_11680 [Agrobacterium fabrum]NTE60435.1 chromosome partitioning protein ParB [Agrobacterium fabrum]
MTHIYEPRLSRIAIDKLRPTQIAVGFREVELKRKEWRETRKKDGDDFLGNHIVPVVAGPKDRAYLIDHHHLVLALSKEGVEHVLTSEVAKFSHLGKDEFWSVMDHRNLIYPFDAQGLRRQPGDIPKNIHDLEDDPFRSLAGALRMAGGYAKVIIPFSEFGWADFLRRRIDRDLLSDSFDEALAEAMKLAKSGEARHLPGWCGVEE